MTITEATAPAPGSPAWTRLVTASKVSAILGLSPWESQYSMWLTMRGDIPPAPENDAMRRGNRLEAAVLDWWMDEHPDHVETARQEWFPLFDWGGATPDATVTNPAGEAELVDAKTASRDDDWRDGVPAYYVASSYWQLACHPEARRVHLAVLFGQPFDRRWFVVERPDESVMAAIVAACKDFHDSLSLDFPPPLDASEATYEAVRALHPDIDRDLTVEVDRALAAEYVAADLDARAAAERQRAAKSALLAAMGRARLAECDGAKVARRQPHRDAVSLVRIAKYIDPEGDQS